MDAHAIAVLGGVGGSVVGVLGGTAGTCSSLRQAKSPEVRRLVGFAAVWAWLGAIAMVTSQFVLPIHWRWFAWVLYALILPLGIRSFHQRYQALSRVGPSA